MKAKWIIAALSCLLVMALALPSLCEPAADAAMPEDSAIIDDFIENFRILAAVPRQSKHEKAVSDRLKAWAEALGFEVRQNEANDLFFDIPATEGFEGLPLIALQTHLDMVCVAAEDHPFDPLTDPINLIVDRDAGTLTADGTTLGADDGAGVALVMSVVKGCMAHGPLRIIFTTDEEIDMSGVLAVTPEDMAGVQYLINIDSEQSDTVTVSSAADATVVLTGDPALTDATMGTAVSVAISGLSGGHSGVMIGEGRCNGIVALAGILDLLGGELPYELVSLTGGIADNAIPAKAQAILMIDTADRAALEGIVAEEEAALRKAYAGVEDGLTLAVTDADAAEKVFDADQTGRILDYVTSSINGVYTMSEVIDGLVESSSNLGQIRADADGIEIRQMPRSSSPERLVEIEYQFRALASENGLSISITEVSKPWPARADSRLVPVIQRIYEAQNGEAIKVEAIHAGLECGVFYELAEGLDMVSIGPDVLNAHSPEETLFLASIPKTWHLLERLLVSLEE